MHHYGHLLGKELLKLAPFRALPVGCYGAFDGLAVEHREYLDVALGILVADVQPELVELIRGGALRVKPYIALFGLSELSAVGLFDQRAGQGVSLSLAGAAYEFGSGGDVAPLVRTAKLEFHSALTVEIEEVVALEQLVGEFCEGHTLAGLP